MSTFDVVLGHDGDGGLSRNNGSHWDCWLPNTVRNRRSIRSYDPSKLGKHLGSSLWKDHLIWLDHPGGAHAVPFSNSGIVDLE